MLYIVHIFNAVWEIIKYIYDYCICGVPVSILLLPTSMSYFAQISYPGDPIKVAQKRKGKWSDTKFQIQSGWHFAGDKESHVISEKQTPKYPLTGESAGRQIWHLNADETEKPNDFMFCAGENCNSGDQLFRKQMLDAWKGPQPSASTPKNSREASIKAMAFYQMLQCEDGHWAGDYGGPMFLMPGLICTLYLSKLPFPVGRREAMVVYLRNHQQTDGGWGTHIECASTMFGTVLSYIALRLLGESPEAEYMVAARRFIHQWGGALYAPSWAKFWMAVIGVYHWDGINSVPSEMWYLPRWFPLHPGKMWCHCRMVYLPMCYLYCKRYTPDVSKDPLLQSLRRELYLQDYNSINWNEYRQKCAEIDEYSPLNPVMKLAQDFLSVYERLLPYMPPFQWLRRKTLEFVISYIHAEDQQTNYVDIGPVNKALNMLAVFVDGNCDINNPAFQRHIARVDDYLWVAEDGMKMQGYNGSQCWDTSFTAQALIEGDMFELFPDCARKIYTYLNRTQIADDTPNGEYFFRHISKGGWPFSTAAHGWPISDCTAEGLKAVLALHSSKLPANFLQQPRIVDERLFDSCNVILSYQNHDGGWATYENNRGYRWYEMLNPSEVFGDIMIDYSYVECSSACITALKYFSHHFPSHRSAEVQESIASGVDFLKSIQRPDGSWYGSWGNCFCYGTWFGIEGLIAGGESPKSDAVQRAMKFLLSKQNPNGGWGESYLSCVNKSYSPDGCGEVSYGDVLLVLLVC